MESDVSREEIFVMTKLYPNQYPYAINAIEEALNKLDIGYIDLLLLHHPGTNDVAAYKTMEQAVADGKSSAQVIFRWNLQKDVVVIPGSSNPAHIKENTERSNFELTRTRWSKSML